MSYRITNTLPNDIWLEDGTMIPGTLSSGYSKHPTNWIKVEFPSPAAWTYSARGFLVIVWEEGESPGVVINTVLVVDINDPSPELHAQRGVKANDLLLAFTHDPVTRESKYRLYAWNANTSVVEDIPQIVRGVEGNWVQIGQGGSNMASEISYNQSQFEIGESVQEAIDTLALLIPQPDYLETLNYTGNYHSGFISGGQTLKYFSAGEYTALITNDSSLDAETITQEFNKADQGELELQEYDGLGWVARDFFDLESAFDDSLRDGNQGSTYYGGVGLPCLSSGRTIEIRSVGIYATVPAVQKGTVRIHLPLTGGDINRWRLYHRVDSTHNYIAEISPVFKDSVAGTPAAAVPTIAEVSLNSLKYLSGIQYYSLTDVISLRSNFTGLFANSYVNPCARIDHILGASDIDISPSDLTGITPVPLITDAGNLNKQITISTPEVRSNNLLPRVTPIGVFNSGASQTYGGSPKVILNTYGNISTGSQEFFVDENYRLIYDEVNDFNVIPSAITGQWDSTEVIVTGGSPPYQQSLQVFNGELKYPQDNFVSGYLPVQDSAADFTSATGGMTYIRAFTHTHGDSYSNGRLTLTGITLANLLNGDLVVIIKLPGNTAWLLLNDPYVRGSFDPDVDYSGCRTTVNGSTFGWTSESRYTMDSGDMIIAILIFADTVEGKALRLTYMENQFTF